MLDKAFYQVYTKFKMHFYQQVFGRSSENEMPLTTVECFCMEGITALGEPTIAEFAKFMNISTPNAAYKVNSLVQKGYIEKIQSKTDKREYHLRPTEKYVAYESITYSYLSKIMDRVRETFSPEDEKKFSELLGRVGSELMPEMEIPEMDIPLISNPKKSRAS